MIDLKAFALLLRSPEIPLGEAALCLAACEREVDIDACLGYLNTLTLRVLERLSNGTPNIILSLNHVLFDEEGFAKHIYDGPSPRYHHLDQVLQEREGSALSLGIVYLEIGWRLGLPLEGVLFPGHFLVKMSVQEQNVLIIDPAAAGQALDAKHLLARLRNAEHSLHIGQVLAALNSASNHDIVLYLIENMRNVYAQRRQWQPYIQLCDALLLLKPTMISTLRDKAEACEQMECFNWALRDYRRYLAQEDDGDERILQRVEKLEQQMKTMH